MKAGDWFTPNRICAVLEHLFNDHKEHTPLIRNLEVFNAYSDRPIIFEEILQRFFSEKVSVCSNPDHKEEQKEVHFVEPDD